MIRGSDGLEYEDLTEKLLGNPAETRYNDWLLYHREQGRSQGFIKAWIEGWSKGENGAKSLTACALQPGGEVFEDLQRRLDEHVPGTRLKKVYWHTRPGVTADTYFKLDSTPFVSADTSLPTPSP